MAASFLPILALGDIERAAQLIQQAYAPQNHLSPQDQKRLQQELFDIQKRPEAWGLVLPLLESTDGNVQFFGAHTAQVKIARDWSSFPAEHALQLRDLIVDVSGRSIALGRSKVILRKLFVAICSLALKIYPQNDSAWPDWIISTVSTLSSLGASNEHLLDFLEIVAQEVENADLLAPSKAQMRRTLLDAVPMVTQAITTCITTQYGQRSPKELKSALNCLQAWMTILPANDLTPFIPLLVSLLNPTSASLSKLEFDEAVFEVASDTLQEVMTTSSLSSGAGSKTLTEPLLLWCDRFGSKIVEETLSVGFVSSVSQSFCKLLVALGDHSTMYFAMNITSMAPVEPAFVPVPDLASPPTRSQLVQSFLRLLLAYTALPGFSGIDEEESELTLGFWYLFQETLWSAEYDMEYDEEQEQEASVSRLEQPQFMISRAVYSELVQVLRRKVVWPAAPVLSGWKRDQRDKFQAYRRDVGDTLINAYYILRDDLVTYFANDVYERISTRQQGQGWEEIEGTLHCIMAVQEALPIEDNPHLRRIFGPEILGRLPSTGHERVRRTALNLIGSYASWFTTQSSTSVTAILMGAVSYVAAALQEPTLCLPAANALRDLCDANRAALAPHVGAFGELYAGLTGIPDTEKAKVLQSVASVIQALPPAEEIPPIEAMLSPVVSRLFEAVQLSSRLPEEARAMAIQQLETLTGAAKGLTRTSESLLIFDDSPEVQNEAQQMNNGRHDPRMIKLREDILNGLRAVVDLWCTDATVSDALSDLIKAITALPTDVTLLSLHAGPLLELLCLAAQRQLTGVWLSLVTMLVVQLDPPSLLPSTFKPIPPAEAQGIVTHILAILLPTSLNALGQPGAMESNPDIVQNFLTCMDTIAQHFVSTFYQIPPELFNSLMQCTLSALALQERYSLVSACTFLVTLINRTAITEELSEARIIFVQTHGRSIMQAILNGLAGVAPRSVTVNLVELLSSVITRFPAESRVWMSDILFTDALLPSKATHEAKEKFIKTVFGTRSSKRIRDAVQQFTLVARGLDGTGFGYASVTM